MSGYSKELIAKTIQAWQPFSPIPLTLHDAEQIASGAVNLIKLLDELEKKYGRIT